jgi:hypothetical protein
MNFAILALLGAVSAQQVTAELDSTYDRTITVAWRKTQLRELFRARQAAERQFARDNRQALRAIDTQAQELGASYEALANDFAEETLGRGSRALQALARFAPLIEDNRISRAERPAARAIVRDLETIDQEAEQAAEELAGTMEQEFEAAVNQQEANINSVGTSWAEADAALAIQWGCNANQVNRVLARGWTYYATHADRFADSCPSPINIDRPAVRSAIVQAQYYIL